MTEELKARIEDLPPELYNHVREDVLRCEHSSPRSNGVQCVYIEATYKYPKLLQIDRYQRKEVAKTLFKGADFRFTSMDVFRKFYLTLDDEFLKMCNSFTITLFDRDVSRYLDEIRTFVHYMSDEKKAAFWYTPAFRRRPRHIIDDRTVQVDLMFMRIYGK